jgi:hypothetical protein
LIEVGFPSRTVSAAFNNQQQKEIAPIDLTLDCEKRSLIRGRLTAAQQLTLA